MKTTARAPEMTGLLLNLGCGPFLAPQPWKNLDVVHRPDDNITPDILQDDPLVIPFPDGTAAMVCVGHLLEHIAWESVPTYLREARRVLTPGTGQICVVGPDWRRALTMWKRGRLDFSIVEACLEGRDEGTGEWEGARHKWNACGDRTLFALEEAGFQQVEEVPIESSRLDPYPVVSRAKWQFAVLAVAP